MNEEEYHILLPLQHILFHDNELTFRIENVKSRYTSVLYFKLHCYNSQKEEIYTYTQRDRWIIVTDYHTRTHTFELPQMRLNDIAYTRIELITIGITSENPLYLTELMLKEGEDGDYHIPLEASPELNISFNNSGYVNLYNNDGTFLQVIRPTRDEITTKRLLPSKCTVLAPHFDEESVMDDPINIFLEFINQKEQRIDVLR